MQIKWLKGTDDLTDAYKIRFKVFIEEQNVPADLEVDDIDGIAHHVVVYQDGIPVGTGRVFEQGGRYYLGRIAVLKEYRKQHIGSLIVKLLLQKAFEWGAEEVHIHAQTSALEFYKKLGFIPYGEPYDEAGIRHISMVAYRNININSSNDP
ncbi:MAG TPA: GNAT family N-acetyltransferase [Tissierellaceae bacterium]